jgi:hypothetical protein
VFAVSVDIPDGIKFTGTYFEGSAESSTDRVGYTVDRAALRREFPDVAFHDFESWAKAQDWNTLLQGA